jgi:hypothetical protein
MIKLTVQRTTPRGMASTYMEALDEAINTAIDESIRERLRERGITHVVTVTFPTGDYIIVDPTQKGAVKGKPKGKRRS